MFPEIDVPPRGVCKSWSSMREAYMLTTGASSQYGITDLQDLAYDAILARLAPANIVEEAFSRFFAR